MPEIEHKHSFDAKKFLANLSTQSGVYKMLTQNNKILYIGKAKNLKRRLSSYFSTQGLSTKIINLVSQIEHIEISITDNEAQALILEQNLIKQHKPPYNVLLKDDKSYPYIFLSRHRHPRLSFHRGAKNKKGDYFGPYPNTSAVRHSLNLLQKVFKVRQCEDSYYTNRTRPCLQYQIKRCLAPCYFEVDDSYQQATQYTKDFLQGKSKSVLNSLADRMEEKSKQLLFEDAAEIRDQIQQLQYIQSKQGFDAQHGNLDILALAEKSGRYCIHCFFIRDGRVLGSRAYFPQIKTQMDPADVLEGFISRHYLQVLSTPDSIITNYSLHEGTGLEQAISKLHNKRVHITDKVRGQRAKWLAMSAKNATENLNMRLQMHKGNHKRLQELQNLLDLDSAPKRMECFDISHHQGHQTYASCVVFSEQGPLKKQYRKFVIKDIQANDDYAAIEQAVFRRYKRLLDEQKSLPDIIFIDGGKGQLSSALKALQRLSLHDMLVLGIAKGPTRKAGFELLYLNDGREIQLDPRSAALHLIQHIRDEAHRFAQQAHSSAKRKTTGSVLEQIPGVGPKRRRELLRHFGGLQQVTAASQDELLQVSGINKKTAALIYAKLR